MLLAEDDDDQDVGEEGHGQDDRHHVAVDRHGQLPRAVPRGAVDVVAVAVVPAGTERVQLRTKERKKLKNSSPEFFPKPGKWPGTGIGSCACRSGGETFIDGLNRPR